MFTATNGDDLFQWWTSVGPEEEVKTVDIEGGGEEL
jgi:hypothetical protein